MTLNLFHGHAPRVAGSMPLFMRGNEADPDDLLPRDPHAVTPSWDSYHVVKAANEDQLVRDHMKYFGTESWVRYMPRLAGLRVQEGSGEFEPAPHWLGGDPPADIRGPNGVLRTFNDKAEENAARALQRSADAAQAAAYAKRAEAAEIQVDALDPAVAATLPVMFWSSIVSTARPGLGELIGETMSPMLPPIAISGQDVNAIDVPVGAMLPLVKWAPREAMRAADAVFHSVNDYLDADPDAKPINADLNLQHLSMPPLLIQPPLIRRNLGRSPARPQPEPRRLRRRVPRLTLASFL